MDFVRTVNFELLELGCTLFSLSRVSHKSEFYLHRFFNEAAIARKLLINLYFVIFCCVCDFVPCVCEVIWF
jgi:hypothetical protein